LFYSIIAKNFYMGAFFFLVMVLNLDEKINSKLEEYQQNYPIFSKVVDFVKRKYARLQGAHDLGHTLRVFGNALYIAEREGGDLEILAYAAMLHDIARPLDRRSDFKHSVVGSGFAHDVLNEYGLEKEKIDKIKRAILAHSFRESNVMPETIEEKVLYDADKLDSLGAIGIARAYHFSGNLNAKVFNDFLEESMVINTEEHSDEDTAYREYLVKLRNIKDKLYTNTAKKIAQRRLKIMDYFFYELKRELLESYNL
jgi:uncharacterized protein